jgi:cytochrome c553
MKSNVFVEDISGPDNADEYGLHSDRFQSCFGAMLWLEQERFIIFESTLKQEAIDQATLTSKGLKLMSSICHDREINALTEQIHPVIEGLKGLPNIDTLNHIMKHGTSSQLALAMQHLIQKYSDG